MKDKIASVRGEVRTAIVQFRAVLASARLWDPQHQDASFLLVRPV